MANIYLQRSAEFFSRFFRLGGTITMVERLLTALMAWWMEQLKNHAKLKLIHGVFNPALDVLETFKSRCADKGIDFNKFTWIGSTDPMSFTTDPDVVVVLDITLDTLQNTIEFAYEWAAEGQVTETRQKGGWRWDTLKTDAEHLRLLQSSEAFKPMTLRWRRIKLNANVGKDPAHVRSLESSPGLALLFVAAQHPYRVCATDYKTRFGWYMPGLECTVPGSDPWAGVPYVDFSHALRRVGLGAYWWGGSTDLAVPVFVE